MAVCEVFLCSRVKQVVETCHFIEACHRNKSVDCTVAFLNGEPTLADEQEFLVVVEIVNHDTTDIP